MKTIGSLFTGGGLFDIGAMAAGYEHIWGIELEDKIASVARLNNIQCHTGNIITFDKSTLRTPNHIHASPPCPNFSVAKTNGKETPLDIQLAESVVGYIEYFKPDTFTLENVTAYAKSESFKIIMKALHDLGYWTDVKNLNSADFGVPQTRKRMIVRARLGKMLTPYPDPVPWVGWYEAIEDLIDTLPESEFAAWQVERLPQEYKDSLKVFIAAGGSAGKNILTKEPKEPIFTIKGNAGGREPVRAFIVNAKEPHGKNGKFTVREEEEPVYTLLNSAAEYRHIASDRTGRVVKMTLHALARFQTVPDDYAGLTTKINGNGVPCKLAEAIMKTFSEEE